MKKSFFSLVMFTFILSGCAGAPISQVPEIPCNGFETLWAPKLTTRTFDLNVKNTKHVNEAAGNTETVEARVYEVLQCVAEKGGFKLVSGSPNKWSVTITDCEVPGNPKDAQDASCVNFNNDLKTPSLNFSGHSSASEGKTYTHRNFVHNGNIEGAYRASIAGLIKQMNEKLK